MKKQIFFALVCLIVLPMHAEIIGYKTYQVKEDAPRFMALQVNAEIGCHFRKAEEMQAAYEPHSFMPAGFCADVGVGLRATRWVYIGAGVGAHSEYALKEALEPIMPDHNVPFSTYRWVMPFYADLRLYIPAKLNMNPFVEGSVGYYWGLTGNKTIDEVEYTFKPQGGLFAQGGAGVDFRRFMVSIGYQYFKNAEYGKPHYLYAKIGVRLGYNVNCDKQPK